jgi:SAM-dependent methyltransferase
VSGFSPEWLALREPADHASINAGIRRALVDALASRPAPHVVDLGCGAGSNLRGLQPWLAGRQRWTLVDYDQRLLDAARARLAAGAGEARPDVSFLRADLSGGAFAPLIAGADLVTAAALFDLVSEPVIDRLAAAVCANRQLFCTVLTYDGIAAFLPEHPLDRLMREAFNAHQRTDKGFGPAAGPGASEALAKAFAARGYRVLRGKSPWVLDAGQARLRRELDQGWANAVRETGQVPARDIDAWIAHRLAAEAAVTIVSHEDLLAMPPPAT